MTRPVSDLRAIADLIEQHELPTIGVRWQPSTGVEVQVAESDANAWFRHVEDVNDIRESMFAGCVFIATPCRMAGVDVDLTTCAAVDMAAWSIKLRTDLFYEEAVSWLRDWPTLTPQQQRNEYADMRGRGVPPPLLPEQPADDEEMAL